MNTALVTDLDSYGVVIIDDVKYVIDNVSLKAPIDYKTLIPLLISEIKNLRQMVDELKEHNETN